MEFPEEISDLWKAFDNDKPSSTFTEYATNKAQYKTVQKINSKYPDFDSMIPRDKNLTLLGDTEGALMDAIKNNKLLPDNKQLKKALDELLEKDLILNTKTLDAARGKVIKEINKTIGENLKNVDEFKQIMKMIEQPASRGSIGEYFAFAKNYLNSGVNKLINPRISVEGIEGFGAKKFISPDQIRIKPNRTVDVKVGYKEADIDAEQLDLYFQLVKRSQSDEVVQSTLKQTGVPEGKIVGHDYLFLPGAEGDALSAAKRAYELIVKNKYENLIDVYYVDKTGKALLYTPNDF